MRFHRPKTEYRSLQLLFCEQQRMCGKQRPGVLAPGDPRGSSWAFQPAGGASGHRAAPAQVLGPTGSDAPWGGPFELPGGIEGAADGIASTITRASAERLGLRSGDTVVAIIKASEVLVAK
jgi:TOBE domain